MTEESRRPLSEREWQVARLVAKGKSYSAVGRALGISSETARAHVSHIAGILPWDFNEDCKPYRRVMLWVMEKDRRKSA